MILSVTGHRPPKVVKTYLETKSIRETARRLGMSKGGVAYHLHKEGVPRFPRNRKGAENSSRKAIVAGTPSAKVRDPKLMQEMYITRRMSTTAIGHLLGVDGKTVYVGLKQCGIKVRSRAEGLKGCAKPNYRGANHRDWKGGVSGWRKRCRGLLGPYWVRPVMERDGFKCQWCESPKKIVVHHHKRSFMDIVRVIRKRLPEATEDELIVAVVDEHTLKDGITLCKKCHDSHHKENGK
jgi:hypothetical protein